MGDESADRLAAARDLAELRAAEAPRRVRGASQGGGVRSLAPLPTASRRKLRPQLRQVGDSLGLSDMLRNWVTRTSLNSQAARFFCTGPDEPLLLLPDVEHPRIDFEFPVKNVHVTLADLGRAGDEEARERLLWDADYGIGQKKRLREVAGDAPSEGGLQPRMQQVCFPGNTPWRLELHVTADDPRTLPGKNPKENDRGIDEIVQFEVRLLPEGDRRLVRLGPRRHVDIPSIHDGPFIESRAPCWPWAVAPACGRRHAPPWRLRPLRQRQRAFL